MKRLFSGTVILLTTALVVFACSCGGQTEKDNDDSDFDPGEVAVAPPDDLSLPEYSRSVSYPVSSAVSHPSSEQSSQASGSSSDTSADGTSKDTQNDTSEKASDGTSKDDSEPKDSSQSDSSAENDTSGSKEESDKTDTDDPTEKSEESEPEELPWGVTRVNDRKLRYSTSVFSLNVTFPDEFCVKSKDYEPEDGIYLENKKGTATLLMRAVPDNTLSFRQMSDYLKEQYPDAYIYVSDHKEIICKLTTTDLAGNELVVLQKLLAKPGGYIEIALCCQPSERTRYEKAFRDTVFQ